MAAHSSILLLTYLQGRKQKSQLERRISWAVCVEWQTDSVVFKGMMEQDLINLWEMVT